MPRRGTPFRYVLRVTQGYQAHAHGWKGRVWTSAIAAARELGAKLKISLSALRKVNPTVVHKTSCLAGVYWHCGKIGWVNRDGSKGVHISERRAAASARSKVKQRIVKKTISLPSRLRHVIYHCGKQALTTHS